MRLFCGSRPEMGLALNFFNLKDENLLEKTIVAKGQKKFLFFGPRTQTLKYTLKPIYKRVVTPFLIELMKKSGLNLYVKVFYKEGVIRVHLSGKDEGLLTKNNAALLNSFEQITRVFISTNIPTEKNTKLSFQCPSQARHDQSEEYLVNLAKKMKDKVLKENRPVVLKPLDPRQRKIIHEQFQDDPTLQTISLGDGRFKRIEIGFK